MEFKIMLKKPRLTISPDGIWVLADEREFFMPFTDFPWFLKATI
jgi:hypothetical protein